jgi:hypothetical protein
VFASGADYLASMALPRPSRPSALWVDIKAVFGAKGPHRLLSAGLAILMPLVAFALFYFSPVKAPYREPDIVYAQQWPANRSDADILAQQAIDAPKEQQARAEQKEHEESRKRALRTLAKTLGMNVDEK